jgi:hypothetical protein
MKCFVEGVALGAPVGAECNRTKAAAYSLRASIFKRQ